MAAVENTPDPSDALERRIVELEDRLSRSVWLSSSLCNIAFQSTTLHVDASDQLPDLMDQFAELVDELGGYELLRARAASASD